MPKEKTLPQKEYPCNFANCKKSFDRNCDLKRHKKTHCLPEEREYGCPFAIEEDCDFRANQLGGLKNHLRSCHSGERLSCPEAGCDRTFSDPSCLCNHRQKEHGAPGRRKWAGASPRTSTGAPRRKPRKQTTPAPLWWLSYAPASATFEFRGAFIRTRDVQSNCSSMDDTTKPKHQQQADNANYSDASQTAGATSPDSPLAQGEPCRRRQSPNAGMAMEASQPVQRCRYYSERQSPSFGRQSQEWERMVDVRVDANGHVYPSYYRPTEYLRPNIGMLF